MTKAKTCLKIKTKAQQVKTEQIATRTIESKETYYLDSEDKRRHYWFGPRADSALLKRVQSLDIDSAKIISDKRKRRPNFASIQIFNFLNITSRVRYYMDHLTFILLRVVCRLWCANKIIRRNFLGRLVIVLWWILAVA